MPNLLSPMSLSWVRRCLFIVIVAIGVAISATTSISAWGKEKADSCEKSLPQSLKTLLQRTYPGYQLVNLSMLTDVGQRLYSQDNKGGCPGVARVRFFDKNKVDYAMVIVQGTDQTHLYNLIYNFIVAKKGKNTSWDLTILEKDQQGAPPAVLTLPPDKYTGDDADQRPRTLESSNEALFLVGYESWSIVYVSTERGIEKVWMSD